MIKLNCHPYPLHVCFTDDINRFNRERQKLCDSRIADVDPSLNGCVTWQGNKIVCGVFVNDRATLVHELAHVVFQIMDHISQPVDSAHSETFCYLLDRMFTQADDWMNKKAERDTKEDD